MKFNIEVEIEDIYDDGSLSDVFKQELKSQVSYKVAELIANKNLNNFYDDKDFKEIKELYIEEIEKVKKGDRDRIEQINEKLTNIFDDFIKGTAYTLNYFGEKTNETTVGEYIRKEAEKYFSNLRNRLDSLIQEEVRKSKIDDYSIKKLVDEELRKQHKEDVTKIVKTITQQALENK